MQFKRSERVQELLRHEISYLVQAISDPQLGFVTITGVHLSDDLSDAKVYYSVLGSEEDRRTSSSILFRAVPHIRHDLGKKLESLRRIPYLKFVYDHTPEQAQKVTEILNKLEHERIDEPAAPPAEAPEPSRKAARGKKKK